VESFPYEKASRRERKGGEIQKGKVREKFVHDFRDIDRVKRQKERRSGAETPGIKPEDI